ncbi:MAG: MarR family transcriptional regulator [Sphingobacteriales bacterium]|nr:MAG: MarR family transcriptional regulator [Sphingobacteriales bacterium]
MKLEQVIKTERFEDARHKATINLLYTAYWYKTHISAELKKHNLTAEQYNVLRILKGKHPEQMCVKDIAGRMIEKNSNVPRIIDRLLEKQLVERNISSADRRETLIALTTKGATSLATASAALKKMTEDIVELSEEDAASFNDMLEKFRKID